MAIKMNNRTSFALLAILTTVGTLTMSSAFAVGHDAYPDINGDGKEIAKKMLLMDIPVSVWTDKMLYQQNSMIKVTGQVANWPTGSPVTLTVTNPLNSVVAVDQMEVNNDGSFETTVSTAGELWKYDGIYVIKVNYGSAEKSNKVLVELAGGIDYKPMREMPKPDGNCMAIDNFDDVDCIPFSIYGGTVTGANINTDDKSIVIQIDAVDDGMLKLEPPQSVIRGIYFVLVDDQEWDDFKTTDSGLKVMFPAGTESVEVIGTWVIPEFGTIAVMILAAAIISIVAITARSRLSIMPRY